ncbi:MAG: hypothetical protein WD512_17930 [Candidatus Paceibacterota bacterium]
MEIEDTNMVLGQYIEGACYVTDRYGGLIGWYDKETKVLYLDDRYKYKDSLLDKCMKANFQIVYSNIEDKEVLKLFAEYRKKVRNGLIKKKHLNNWIDEHMKYLPSRRYSKKVKDAETKINKRHE